MYPRNASPILHKDVMRNPSAAETKKQFDFHIRDQTYPRLRCDMFGVDGEAFSPH